MATESKSIPCPHCLIGDRTQHSLRQSGLCDGVKNNHLLIVDGKFVKKPKPTNS